MAMATTATEWASRSRRGARRSAAVLLLAIAMSLAGAPRPAEAATTVEVLAAAYDVTILRPLNACAVVLGSVFFVASAPFVAPFMGVRTARDVFVYAPYEYTVERDIGDF